MAEKADGCNENNRWRRNGSQWQLKACRRAENEEGETQKI